MANQMATIVETAAGSGEVQALLRALLLFCTVGGMVLSSEANYKWW